jgi:hypothetical protein
MAVAIPVTDPKSTNYRNTRTFKSFRGAATIIRARSRRREERFHMSKARPDFKRMLLRLPHSRQDYPAVAMTAELAALLGLDLVGTFFDESSLLRFAELPTTREFRAGGWHPLDTDQLTRELALAEREAERLFQEAIGPRCAGQQSGRSPRPPRPSRFRLQRRLPPALHRGMERPRPGGSVATISS